MRLVLSFDVYLCCLVVKRYLVMLLFVLEYFLFVYLIVLFILFVVVGLYLCG